MIISISLPSLPFRSLYILLSFLLGRLAVHCEPLNFAMQLLWDDLCFVFFFLPPCWSPTPFFLQYEMPLLSSISGLPDLLFFLVHFRFVMPLPSACPCLIGHCLLSFPLPSHSPLPLYPLPVLFDLILLLSEICFPLQRVTEVFFICNAFISREHKGELHWEAFCEASSFRFLRISVHGGII